MIGRQLLSGNMDGMRHFSAHIAPLPENCVNHLHPYSLLKNGQCSMFLESYSLSDDFIFSLDFGQRVNSYQWRAKHCGCMHIFKLDDMLWTYLPERVDSANRTDISDACDDQGLCGFGECKNVDGHFNRRVFLHRWCEFDWLSDGTSLCKAGRSGDMQHESDLDVFDRCTDGFIQRYSRNPICGVVSPKILASSAQWYQNPIAAQIGYYDFPSPAKSLKFTLAAADMNNYTLGGELYVFFQFLTPP
jgi:hypothetical protein